MALAPFAFGASKEIQELQRDVALLQDQVRTLQRAQDEKFAAMQALVQQTLDSVNRTNTAVAVMENKFNDTMKQQQQSRVWRRWPTSARSWIRWRRISARCGNPCST